MNEGLTVSACDVVTDTTTLWTIDSLVHQDYADWRGLECLMQLVDYLVDPTKVTYCLFPSTVAGSGSVLPDCYKAFKDTGLILHESGIGANNFPLADNTHKQFFRLFERWCNSHNRYPEVFRKLHEHPNVRGGWQERVGIPPEVVEFISTVKTRAGRLCGDLGWQQESLALVYSIVARGMQYSMAAHEKGRLYFTHPVRRIAGSTECAQARDFPLVVVPLGAVILRGWKKQELPSFGNLAEMIVKVRERASKRTDLWKGMITERAAIRDAEKELVQGIIPGALSDRAMSTIEKSVDTVSATLAGGIGGLVGGPLAGAAVGLVSYAMTWSLHGWADRYLKDASISPALAGKPIIRPFVNYPRLETLKYTICSRCSTETALTRCPVCGHTERKT